MQVSALPGGRSAVVGLGLLWLVAASGCTGLRYKSSEDLWSQSDKYFNAGQYGDAVPIYDELLRRDNEDAQARLMRGVARERTGDVVPALEDYAQVGHSGDVRGLLYSANLHIRQGEYGMAEDALGRLKDMGLSGRDGVIQLTLLGTLRLGQGQYGMAAQNLERALEAGSGFGDPTIQGRMRDAHYNAASAYYRLGDFGRAYDHVMAFASGGGLSANDHYVVGLLAYLAGDFEASEDFLSDADPDQVARAAEILDDPTFGASNQEWNQ